MTTVFITFTLLLTLICATYATRKESTHFQLVTGFVFSVVFFVLGVLIWFGGNM